MSDAFYLPDGDGRFLSTERTIGPWGPTSQHAGPPAALLGRAVELCESRPDTQVTSITYDILKPVPIAPLEVSARVVRPGRKVELVEGSLKTESVEVMRCRAWRIRTENVDVGYDFIKGPTPPPPQAGRAPDLAVWVESPSYLTSMEVRFISGDFQEAGPAVAWFRPRYPLVAGETISPLGRVLIAADSASGISSALDWREWLFVNPDLTIHLHRMPASEWICLEAVTYPEPHGVGMTAAVIWDETGPLGRSLQSLFVAPRADVSPQNPRRD